MVTGTIEERILAQRAVFTHRAESWPSATLCANCHAMFPCSWHRWGTCILLRTGWTNTEIANLVERGPRG
jgi:hypothetical protein